MSAVKSKHHTESKDEDHFDDQKSSELFNVPIDSANANILLEQYKIYIDSANLTSSLRSQANTFFLTINTALIGFISGILSFTSLNISTPWMSIACISGVLLCISWFYALRSYRSLNSGRFTVIQELEKQLPAKIYAREWDLITSRRPNSRRAGFYQICR